VSVADGSSLWRQQFDRKLSGVFALQEELAKAIAGAMRVKLVGGKPLVQRTTEDVAAYQLQLRGRYAWNQRTAASLRQADAFFTQAVARDPGYARAWAGIADVHIVQALNLYAPAGPNFTEGKAAALKALALDSTLAEAHASLGTVQFLHDRDWDAAEASYRRAIALDPNYAATHYFYCLFLSARGRVAEALAEAERAMTLDPLAPPMAQASGIVYVQQRRYAEAIAPLRAAIALQPQYYFPHTWLAIALANTGAREEAVAEATRAVELAPDNSLVEAIAGYVNALVGNRAAAEATVARLEAAGRTRTVPYSYLARIEDALGNAPRALAFLERALSAEEGQLAQLHSDRPLLSLAKNPRYLQIVKQLHLE
jgi:tetratricopeptide (TPR) repeat protein